MSINSGIGAEPYSGIYEVTIKFIEYKKVGVRTTDVPYIQRPGKSQTPPDTVVFGKGVTPYKRSEFEKKSSEVNGKRNRTEDFYYPQFMDNETGEPINNPCTLENGKEYQCTFIGDREHHAAKGSILAKIHRASREK